MEIREKKARFFEQRGRVEGMEERNKSRQKQERNQCRQRRNCKSFFFQKVVGKRWKQIKRKGKGKEKCENQQGGRKMERN